MAKLGDLVVRIGADTRDLNKQLGRVQRNMRSMTSNLTSLGQTMTKAITLPLAGLGAMAVKSAADLEQLETSFVSLTGGVEEAAAMMQQLNEFTAKTPFQIENVANAARQLIASGTQIGDVNDQLQFLGDIAATSGVTIEEIAAIFAKVNAKGKVELENLNQLAERGIPIFKALADATGLPADKLGAGAVSVDQFNEVLKSFATEGGFAAGAMERLSQTAAGKFSTALDNLKIAGAEIGNLVLPAVTKLLDLIVEMAQKFAATSQSTKALMLEVGLLVGAIGPMIVIVPKIIAGITGLRAAFTLLNTTMLANPALAVVAAIAALTTAVVLFRQRTQDASKANEEFIQTLVGLDKQAQINHIKDQMRELQREKAALAAAQRAEMQAQAAGALGDRLDKQVARGSAQKYAGQIEFLDERIADLAATVRNLSTESDAAEPQVAALGNAAEKSGEQFKIFKSEVSWLLLRLENTKTEVFGLLSALEAVEVTSTSFTSKLLLGLERMSSEAKKVSNVFEDMGEALATSIGNAVGHAENMRQALVEAAKAVIIAALAQAKAQVIARAAEGSAGTGPAYPFVMAGLLTAGMALINSVQIPALAEGGLAYGATTAIVGDNPNARVDPEVIAPLSKLQDIMGASRVEVFGRISGSDIVLANDRGTRNRNRVI
jgi:tape measure domain-containing protein